MLVCTDCISELYNTCVSHYCSAINFNAHALVPATSAAYSMITGHFQVPYCRLDTV
jgi:hypothetical protein